MRLDPTSTCQPPPDAALGSCPPPRSLDPGTGSSTFDKCQPGLDQRCPAFAAGDPMSHPCQEAQHANLRTSWRLYHPNLVVTAASEVIIRRTLQALVPMPIYPRAGKTCEGPWRFRSRNQGKWPSSSTTVPSRWSPPSGAASPSRPTFAIYNVCDPPSGVRCLHISR